VNANRLTYFGKSHEKARVYDAFLVTALFLSMMWGCFLAEEFLNIHLKNYGMHPRSLEGIAGIFTMTFLHADWKHIAQNSLGLLVMNSMLFYFYRNISFKVILILIFGSGALLWFIGRASNHIGASMLIYGEWAFLLVSGIIRKHPNLRGVALLVALYYGSLIWYIFPVDQKISWEGHLSGFLIGLVCAFALRKQGPPDKVYQYQLEPELPDDENAYWKIPDTTSLQTPAPESENQPISQPTTITVRYHYKESNKSNETGAQNHKQAE
jgi:membrane associated rhomboid family serine protease